MRKDGYYWVHTGFDTEGGEWWEIYQWNSRNGHWWHMGDEREGDEPIQIGERIERI